MSPPKQGSGLWRRRNGSTTSPTPLRSRCAPWSNQCGRALHQSPLRCPQRLSGRDSRWVAVGVRPPSSGSAAALRLCRSYVRRHLQCLARWTYGWPLSAHIARRSTGRPVERLRDACRRSRPIRCRTFLPSRATTLAECSADRRGDTSARLSRRFAFLAPQFELASVERRRRDLGKVTARAERDSWTRRRVFRVPVEDAHAVLDDLLAWRDVKINRSRSPAGMIARPTVCCGLRESAGRRCAEADRSHRLPMAFFDDKLPARRLTTIGCPWVDVARAGRRVVGARDISGEIRFPPRPCCRSHCCPAIHCRTCSKSELAHWDTSCRWSRERWRLAKQLAGPSFRTRQYEHQTK